MQFSSTVALVAFSRVANAVLACSTSSVEINSNSDYDEVSSCSALTGGSLVIAWDYQGDFSFPGLISIALNIDAGTSTGISVPELGTPGVTSIELPDLESLGGSFRIAGVPNLESFSVPKLKTIGEEIVIGSMAATELSFPELESIGGRSVFYGNFESISFPSLKNANYFDISTTGNLDCEALWDQLSGVVWDQCDAWGCETSGFECESAAGKFEHLISPPVYTLVVTEEGTTETIYSTCTASEGHYCTGNPSAAATSTAGGVVIASITITGSARTRTVTVTSTSTSAPETGTGAISVLSTSSTLTSSLSSPITTSASSTNTGSTGVPKVTSNAGLINKPTIALFGAGMAILAAL